MSSEGRIDQFFVMHSARADRWREALSAAEHWADGKGTAKNVESCLTDLEILEEFDAYPSLHAMRTLRARFATEDARVVCATVRRISDAILTNSAAREIGFDESGENDRLSGRVRSIEIRTREIAARSSRPSHTSLPRTSEIMSSS